jgi:hypothetical protein
MASYRLLGEFETRSGRLVGCGDGEHDRDAASDAVATSLGKAYSDVAGEVVELAREHWCGIAFCLLSSLMVDGLNGLTLG